MVDDCQAQPSIGEAGDRQAQADALAPTASRDLELTVWLPSEAAQDLLGKSSRLLGQAMRDTGVIMTLEHAAHASCTALRLQGRLRDMNSLSRCLGEEVPRRYLGDWTGTCKAQLDKHLLHLSCSSSSFSSSSSSSSSFSSTPLRSSASQQHKAGVPGGAGDGQPDSEGLARVSHPSCQRCHRAILCTKADMAGAALGGLVNAAATSKAPVL
jgi:hypothetical protein